MNSNQEKAKEIEKDDDQSFTDSEEEENPLYKSLYQPEANKKQKKSTCNPSEESSKKSTKLTNNSKDDIIESSPKDTVEVIRKGISSLSLSENQNYSKPVAKKSFLRKKTKKSGNCQKKLNETKKEKNYFLYENSQNEDDEKFEPNDFYFQSNINDLNEDYQDSELGKLNFLTEKNDKKKINSSNFQVDDEDNPYFHDDFPIFYFQNHKFNK